jgi:hypothetical protein
MVTKLSTFIATAPTANTSSHYYVEINDDGFVRPKTLENVQDEIVTTAVLGSGTATSRTVLRGDRSWGSVAVGGGSDSVFYENDQNVTTNYTISENKNALSAGPITIAANVSITIPSGSVWTIV